MPFHSHHKGYRDLDHTSSTLYRYAYFIWMEKNLIFILNNQLSMDGHDPENSS